MPKNKGNSTFLHSILVITWWHTVTLRRFLFCDTLIQIFFCNFQEREVRTGEGERMRMRLRSENWSSRRTGRSTPRWQRCLAMAGWRRCASMASSASATFVESSGRRWIIFKNFQSSSIWFNFSFNIVGLDQSRRHYSSRPQGLSRCQGWCHSQVQCWWSQKSEDLWRDSRFGKITLDSSYII